ncbi:MULTISPECIES: transglycosylase family protein [unclassified Streptomyces]|uniref:transglycosylase family protein n=1 Tax=unclassified Streptomyces TaxID=2593676 RepID=UPI00166072E0|nr:MULTISPECIES: transglycosylase family protein [unclassified Streptomyces]
MSRTARTPLLAGLAAASLVSLGLVTVATVTAGAASVATWDRVAQCESTGNWSINTGNGYYGGLQISLYNWRYYGGLNYAARPDLATKKQQILIAEKILADQGARAWSCSPGTGLATDHANPYPDPTPTPAPAPSWKTQILVNGGGAIFHATRGASGTWSGFADIGAQAGNIGSVGSVADAGINGDTHVVAVGGNGHVYHAVRFADGQWGAFGDVNSQAGALDSVTKVSAVSIGSELNVLAVANGRVFHSVRHTDGTWSAFGDVESQAGSLPAAVTSVSEASVNGRLQVVAVAGARVYHSIRGTDGTWSAWGDVYAAAGDAGAATDVAVTGSGADLQIVVASNGGTKQYHGARLASGQWTPLTDLTSVAGSFTTTSVSAATVAGELQVAFVTTDDRILHAIRHVDGTWQSAAAINLTGVTGNHYAAGITGTL